MIDDCLTLSVMNIADELVSMANQILSGCLSTDKTRTFTIRPQVPLKFNTLANEVTETTMRIYVNDLS